MTKGVICILVCMLMMLTTVVPVSANSVSKTTSHPLSTGNILYVGGLGPNNYTKIQDAIDNASNGDTVFVFDDSSPYFEDIVINTSISLLGEEKNTTLINGSGWNNNESIACVLINADNVMVQGFTIQYGNTIGIGILSKNNSIIADNIISDNYEFGIASFGFNNTIKNNFFIRDGAGIEVSGGNNIVTRNIISQCGGGIGVLNATNTNISYNVISNCSGGYASVGIFTAYNTVVYRNNISHNGNIGLYTTLSSADRILQNNFIGNKKSASSNQRLLILIFLKFNNLFSFPIHRNVWDRNYWDGPRSYPYVIPGRLRFWVDWHPAQEPYDIPVMS